MRITFLNPPFHPMFSRESRSPCVTKSSTLYWPMFLSYAAGSAEAEGHEIQLIDSPAMSLNLQETIEKIKPFSPELFIVSTSTPSILNDLKVVKALKETFNVPVAIMGTHASAEPLESLEMESALDYCIIGEADRTVCKLASLIEGKIQNANEIFLEGFVCKKPNYRKTPFGREIADVMLAVNRPYGKADYIPCIVWGRNARYVESLEVGECIRLYGRRRYILQLLFSVWQFHIKYRYLLRILRSLD